MARLQVAAQTGPGSTRWFKLNPHVDPFSVSVQVGLAGTAATYQVEVTLDEVDAVVGELPELLGDGAAPPPPLVVVAPGTAPASADGLFAIQQPVAAVRVTVTAGAGTVHVRVLQAGIT